MKALSPIPDCMEIGLSLCIASYVFSYLQVLKTLSDPNHFHFKIFGFEEFISTKKTMPNPVVFFHLLKWEVVQVKNTRMG